MLTKNILLVLGEHFSGRAHNTLGLDPVPKTNQANLVVQVLATWKRNEAAWLTSDLWEDYTLECCRQGCSLNHQITSTVTSAVSGFKGILNKIESLKFNRSSVLTAI